MSGYLQAAKIGVVALLALLYQAAPTMRRGRLFGRRVEPGFRGSAEGRRLLRRYRLVQLALAAAALLGAALAGGVRLGAVQSGAVQSGAVQSGAVQIGGTRLGGVLVGAALASGLPLTLLYVGAASAIWAWGWRRAGAYAVPGPQVRIASLRPSRAADRVHLASLLPLAAAGAYLGASWRRIPPRFPVHWNAAGVANHWVDRSPASVFLPLALAALVVLWLGLGLRYGAPGRRRALVWILPVVAWSIALAGCATALLPLRADPARLPAALLLIAPVTVAAILVTVLLAMRAEASGDGGSAEEAAPEDATPDGAWLGGLLYFNRSDAALWVPKRSGLGWTLNFARPASWLMMAALLALPLLTVGLMALARR